MSRYYHYHYRQSHYRPELVLPLAIVATLLIVVFVMGVFWLLPDNPVDVSVQEAPLLQPPAGQEKPSRLTRFLRGVARAMKDSVEP